MDHHYCQHYNSKILLIGGIHPISVCVIVGFLSPLCTVEILFIVFELNIIFSHKSTIFCEYIVFVDVP